MNYDEIKKQLLARIDEVVEAIGDKRTIEIRIGKNDEVQLFDVRKRIIHSEK